MNNSKNILVLTSWSYKDGLIQAYTLPYLYIISKLLPPKSTIYLVTLEKKGMFMTAEEKNKARQTLLAHNIKWISLLYRKFNFINIFYWLIEWIFLITLIFTKQIKYIHAWCTPAGAVGYLLSLFTGRKLIIDSYEPHAEAMVENGTWRKNDLQFRILFYFEKKLSHRADALIGATEKMGDYAKEKYGNFSDSSSTHFYYKPACVDVEMFFKKKNYSLAEQLGLTDKIVCVYAGKFGGIYLTDEVFNFFKEAEDYWGARFRALLLTPHSEEELLIIAKKNNFDSQKMIIRFVNHSQIAEYMKLGTFAITPVKPVPTKRFCTPIKDAEYWAAGLPVIITKNISDDSDIIEKNNIGAVIQEFTKNGYLEAIKKIDELIKGESSESLSIRIVAVAKKYRNFSIAEEVYKKIYG
jgi:hypothetical protein